MTKMFFQWTVVCGLALAACGGKDRVGEVDATAPPVDAQDAAAAEMETDAPRPDECVPQCLYKGMWEQECGYDNVCATSCGECPPEKPTCVEGTCTTCRPECDDRWGGECDAGLCVLCEPTCYAKECGEDGCGGHCGCAESETCVPDLDGKLVCKDVCAVACEGTECGVVFATGYVNPDCEGCLGLDFECPCDCPPGEICASLVGDTYHVVSEGDGSCYVKSVLCGNGVCDSVDAEETCGTCLADCVCGAGSVCVDGTCCAQQCAGKECGPDGCGGVCGVCEANAVCTIDAKCLCIPDCAGKECGPDGCGGSCGECSKDCPVYEECWAGHCVALCQPDCTGKECGDDGCGCPCGECAEGQECVDGGCICMPSCEDNCGDDGCGGSCAEPIPEGCHQGLPEQECEAVGGYSWYPGCVGPADCICGCPTGDDGCPCTSSSQCQGLCVTVFQGAGPGVCENMIVGGTCAPYDQQLGCMCTLDEAGLPSFGCWD